MYYMRDVHSSRSLELASSPAEGSLQGNAEFGIGARQELAAAIDIDRLIILQKQVTDLAHQELKELENGTWNRNSTLLVKFTRQCSQR
jgi:hypothetical protein